jgi:toxin ParE1/3/4
MTVRWTPTALRDLESLHSYIAEDRAAAAGATVDALMAGIAAPVKHPEMGRKGRVTGTRELVMVPFVIAYRAHRSTIEVLAIIHGARRWPESF